jgi:hypothetical protein
MAWCLNCQTELNHLDDDPNGDKNAVCARCRAEEAHDFDREPDARFDRAGRRLEDVIELPKASVDAQEHSYTSCSDTELNNIHYCKRCTELALSAGRVALVQAGEVRKLLQLESTATHQNVVAAIQHLYRVSNR